ncbi:unnamed protein product [Ectocarpus sp. 4 AP-2014]
MASGRWKDKSYHPDSDNAERRSRFPSGAGTLARFAKLQKIAAEPAPAPPGLEMSYLLPSKAENVPLAAARLANSRSPITLGPRKYCQLAQTKRTSPLRSHGTTADGRGGTSVVGTAVVRARPSAHCQSGPQENAARAPAVSSAERAAAFGTEISDFLAEEIKENISLISSTPTSRRPSTTSAASRGAHKARRDEVFATDISEELDRTRKAIQRSTSEKISALKKEQATAAVAARECSASSVQRHATAVKGRRNAATQQSAGGGSLPLFGLQLKAGRRPKETVASKAVITENAATKGPRKAPRSTEVGPERGSKGRQRARACLPREGR